MHASYSRNSIIFLEGIVKIGIILAIIPSYDFNKKEIVRKNVYRLYSLTVVSVVVFVFNLCRYMINRWHLDTPNVLLSGLFLAINSNIFLLFVVTSIGSAFWNLNLWERLFRGFTYIEKHLNTELIREMCLVKNCYFQLLVFNIVMLANLVHLITIIVTFQEGLVGIISYIIIWLTYYLKFFKLLVVSNLALAIKCKFEDINKFLIKECGDVHVRSGILTASRLFSCTNEMVNIFNKLFGWELLLNLSHTFLLEMLCFNGFLLTKADYGFEFPTNVLVSLILMGLLSLVCPILVIFTCDWAVKETEKLVSTCYKYQAYFPTFSEEKQELLNLASHIINKKPAFSAAGFFEVNCKTLLALFGTTTTYVIVKTRSLLFRFEQLK